MAILQGTVTEVVLAILEGSPDPRIAPNIWHELVKLQTALKELAALVDAKIAAKVDIPFEQVGSLNSALYLGGLTTVKVVAAQALSPGMPVWFRHVGGNVLKAYGAYDGPADGCCLNAVAAGAVGDFILKGLAVHQGDTVSPIAYITPYPHGRLATQTQITAFSGSLPKGTNASYQYPGYLSWLGNATKEYYYRYYSGRWFIGTDIGYYTYSSQYESVARLALMYFNPRKV